MWCIDAGCLGNGSPLSLYLIKSTLKRDFCMKSFCFLMNTRCYSVSIRYFIFGQLRHFYTQLDAWLIFIGRTISNEHHSRPFWNWEVRICNEYPTYFIPYILHISAQYHSLVSVSESLCLSLFFSLPFSFFCVHFSILVTIRSWE